MAEQRLHKIQAVVNPVSGIGKNVAFFCLKFQTDIIYQVNINGDSRLNI